MRLEGDTGREKLVDAVVSGVMNADDRELAEEAAAAGEDIADAAASLRARFLERVAAARVRAVANQDTATSDIAEGDGVDDDCPRAIGRYPILRRLGAGGMGVVYAAYDELLDRRLAIKVLHDHVWDVDGRRRERLLREAQAMARVAHPNLITVHEVGTAGEQLFVAMEFVPGPTLREWLAIKQRSWTEVVPVFRQIADGLAALHDAGLVHRDVKPSNVLIGDDGRVRVLDLGLAASGSEKMLEAVGTADLSSSSSSSSSAINRIEGPLTRTGERLGTPAYMSREQHLGLELTPASDIFSLCVALYEALYGIHPFLAATFHELQSNVMAGRIAPPSNSSSVPAWLHALVVRGLAPDPKDRPPSMRALSTELGKDPTRARRRWIGSLATAACAGLVGVFVAQAQTPSRSPICDAGEAAVAEVWNTDRAAQVRAAMLATKQPYASALADRVTDALDVYAGDWAVARDRICHEHARGDHSDEMLDARMACLDRRRQALAETVTILADADVEVVEHAGQMTAKLPRLQACDDLERFLADDGRPRDPALATAFANLESRLVRAEALANAGRTEESIGIAREVATAAEAIEQPSLVAGALLGEARASILQFDRSANGRLLGRALELSITHGLNTLAAEAMIRRLYERGLASGGSEAALADVPIAKAMLVRAGDDPELRALLFTNVGAIHVAAGQRELAREAFASSLSINERLYGDDHLELAVSLANLGMLTADAATRSALHQRMIDIYERRLGPDHPRTLDARLLAAFHTADPELASAALQQLCPRFRAIDELRFAGECELERGRIELARGRLDLARPAFERARELLDDDERRVLLDGYLALGSADPHAAIAALRQLIEAVDARQDGGDWWVRLDQAERRLLLARLRLQSGTPAAAVVELEQAIVDLQAIANQAQPIERDRLLASAQAVLAEALAASESADPNKRLPP
jgi:tRNA A-37 threonylcarbamoyl transferase component Bud32/tetratricopeptide (TPR) repeat protein